MRWSIIAPLYANVKAAISRIDENDWKTIDYPEGGEAQVAETTIWATDRNRRQLTSTTPSGGAPPKLVGDQATLWPDWRYHAFTTDTAAIEADQYHRRHASVELAIRDLKESAGLAHLPSANFAANAAWLACAALAHSRYRWITGLGRTQPAGRLTTGRTIRNRLFAIPGRLVNHGSRHILRLPAQWPWAATYHTTLTNLRGLPNTPPPAGSPTNHQPNPHTEPLGKHPQKRIGGSRLIERPD